MKFTLRREGEQRGWPQYLLWGRMRTSTAALLVAFCVSWWLYQTYQPPPAAVTDQPAQVVPPGFVPDPDYTWVPRTNVQERPRTTESSTTEPTTTTTTTDTTEPTDTTDTSPTSPTEPSVPIATTIVDPDGPGPLPPTTVTVSPGPSTIPNRSGTPTTVPTTPTVPTATPTTSLP